MRVLEHAYAMLSRMSLLSFSHDANRSDLMFEIIILTRIFDRISLNPFMASSRRIIKLFSWLFLGVQLA